MMAKKWILMWTVLALFSVGTTSFLMGQAVTPVKQSSANTSQVGRYQIIVNPNIRADTFLLDTQTGKTWIQTEITNAKGKPTVWMFRERVDNEQEFHDWTKRQTVEDDQKDK
jgi:hypothetical protein